MAGRKVRQKHEWIGLVSPFGDSGIGLQPGMTGRLEYDQTREWVRWVFFFETGVVLGLPLAQRVRRVDVGRNPE